MQEHYVFLQHLHQYLIVSILLRHRQGLDLVKMRLSCRIQSTHFQFVNIEDAFIDERLDHSCRASRLVHQLFLRHLLDTFPRRISLQTIPMRKSQKGGQGLRLLQGTLYHIERHMQHRFISITNSQLHIEFHLRLILLYRFHTSRHGRIIYIAKRRHIVIADPLPKAILLGKKRGIGIKNSLYRFTVEFRFFGMHISYHGNILLAFS